MKAGGMPRAAVFFLLPLAACLGGCLGTGNVSAPPAGPELGGPGDSIVFDKKTFELLKTPDAELESMLEGTLSSSYETAVKNHAGDRPLEIGFAYSMAPKGAVYPMSEIEVSCIMQEKYASRNGPELCGDFFAELEARIKTALAGRQ